MKRLLLGVAVLLAPPAAAQSPAELELMNAITNGGRWGNPRYTSTSRPACGTSNLGAKIENTTTATEQRCNGTAWVDAAAATSLAAGTAVTGGGALRVLFEDASQLLATNANYTFDPTTNANYLQLGAGTAPGAMRLLEGSGGGTNYGVITVPSAMGGNRTYTFQDADTTIAGINIAQSWATNQTMNGGFTWGTTAGAYVCFAGINYPCISQRTAMTPDSPLLLTSTTSESWHIAQNGDQDFDFNNGRCLTGACTNPSLVIHSPDQVTTEYLQLSADATGVAHVQANFAEVAIGGTKTGITESSAQPIVRIGLPTSTNVYGMTLDYTVYDINGSNYVARKGSVKVQGGNASGTVLCTINLSQDTDAEDGSQIVTSNAYTLTYTWTNVVSTTNCDLSLNAASSAGTNTYAVTWVAKVTGNSNAITVTAQ